MLHQKVGGLPVVDRGILVGVVTTTDMIRAFLEVVEDFAETHPAAPSGAPRKS